MNIMLPTVMICLSAAIILTLGVVHLTYTYYGPRLRPRDRELQSAMELASPVLTSDTTMWKAWIGFNASHSLGAILFGLVYGYLSVFHPEVLFESRFLIIVGIAMLGGLLFLAQRYWFKAPFTGIAISLVCFSIGVIAW